jgi:hypothetical protein
LKIAVVIISSKNEPYLSLDDAVRKTWGNVKHPDIEIFYCYGGEKLNFISGNDIYTNHDETLSNIGRKILTSFEMIKDRKFSYLFRTNTSSYIFQDNMINFLKNKPTQNFYCGVVGRYHLDSSIAFCSGAGYFLSRDVFNKILDHSNDWDHSHLDDVSLGIIMKNLNVPISNVAKRLTLSDINFNYDEKILREHYHVRCASYQGKRTDSKIEEYHMKRIHSFLNNDLG